jgi:hypothetical protein
VRLLAAVALAACATGAPPGFSTGTLWTFPLVDPLSDGRLVTPVFVDGHGPYLFAIDPDAQITIVDGAVIATADVLAHGEARLADQFDVSHPTFATRLPNVRIGDLSISLLGVVSIAHASFDEHGRRISGILGRDVIADSLVFGFDRERGIAWLTTQEAFRPPAGAQELAYFKGTPRAPVVHKLVKARVGDKSYDLHLDLSRVPSQLRAEHWADAGFALARRPVTVIDDIGFRRDVDGVGIAGRVEAGGVARDRIDFVPYTDRRWWQTGELEGTLGLGFFRPYVVAADWQHERFYLSPRTPSATATVVRLARWGTLMPACDHPGCVFVGDPIGDATTAGVRIARDPPADRLELEVRLGATTAAGALPDLIVELPAGVKAFDAALDPQYAGAKLEVVDVSPFSLPCAGPGRCVTIAP